MKIFKNTRIILFIGLIITFIFCSFYIYRPNVIKFLDYQSYDILLRNKAGSSNSSNQVIIVDIDNKSLKELGQWPWPRYRIALLLAKLKSSGALSVGLDMLFAESDRTSLKNIKNEFKKDLNLDISFVGVPKDLYDNDLVFSNFLQGHPFILGYFFEFEKQDENSTASQLFKMNPIEIKEAGAPKLKDVLTQAVDVISPLPVLLGKSSYSGFFNTVSDEDGLLRKVPLFMTYKNKVYPSLALSSLWVAMNKPQIMLKLSKAGLESVRMGQTIIPVDRAGRIMVNFLGPQGIFKYISAVNVLQGNFAPDLFRNKIVFIGTSAAGLKDLRATPFDPVYPGVETHATIVDSILRQDFLYSPDWVPGLELLVILVLGIIFSSLLAFSRARAVIPLIALTGFGVWQGSSFIFNQYKIFVSPVCPLLLLASEVGLLSLAKFFLEEKEKQFLRSAFSQFVAPSVVKKLTDQPSRLELGGENKNVSILFSDIRSFTTMSEKLSAVQISNLLRDYFSPMTNAITDNLGTIDKFIGDAIMAFWNAPIDIEQHEIKSVLSSLKMLEVLKKMQPYFREEYDVDLKIGIGIHCGEVQVGNMGSEDLFNYTIIGDNVNLASRMEGLTKFYGLELLISEQVKNKCQDIFFILYIDKVRVKGKDEPVSIFTVYPDVEVDKRKKEFELYKQAIMAYKGRNFSVAKSLFTDLNDEYGLKLYELYLERCEQMLKTPPGDDWDGVFTHKTK